MIGNDKTIRLTIQGDNFTMKGIVQDNLAICTVVATPDGLAKTLLIDNNNTETLFVNAFNNRTRQLNYFKLYCSLLEGDITEDEFDDELDNKPDEYVVPIGTDADISIIEKALKLATRLKGLNSTDDFMSLFSINDKSMNTFITKSGKL